MLNLIRGGHAKLLSHFIVKQKVAVRSRGPASLAKTPRNHQASFETQRETGVDPV